MTVGDIKYEHDMWVQEGTVDSSVSKGDLLTTVNDGSSPPNYEYTPVASGSDPTELDAVALEDGDADDVIRVLITGVIEVDRADPWTDETTTGWEAIPQVIVMDEYPLELDSGNIVIYLK